MASAKQKHTHPLPQAVRKLGYTPAVVMGAMGLSLTIGIYLMLVNVEKSKISTDLTRVTHTRSAAIHVELDIAEDAVDAIANFCDVMDDATRFDFGRFSKFFVNEAPGLRGFAWIPRVPHNRRAECEAAARKDGLTDFQITEWAGPASLKPAGKRNEYYPVYFIATDQTNKTMFGLDLGSYADSERLIVEARDTGKPMVSPRFFLPHKQGQSPSCIFIQPVYEKGRPTTTVEQRRRHLRGFVAGAFDFSQIVAKGMAVFPPEDVHIQFVDRSIPGKEDIFFTYCANPTGCCCEQTVSQSFARYGLSHTADFELQIGGGTWRLVFTPGPAFIEGHRTWLPWIILGCGLFLTMVGVAVMSTTIYLAIRNERAILDWTDALRKSEERYRSLVENIDMGIALIDPDHNIVAVNSAHARLFNKTSQELIGKKCYREFEKCDFPCENCPGVRAMEAGQSAEMERVGIRDDGSRFVARVSAFRILGNKGEIVGFIEVVEDVTERKEAERALQQYAVALEEANRVLEHCSQTAQTATRAKSEFLANMSHEIRTPLTAIMGYAGLLMGTLPRSSDEHQAVSTIKRNGDYLLAIINDILDLSKIEAGKMEVCRTACSPIQIIAELLSLMSVNAEAKGLRLDVEYDGSIPESINSDPVRLRQILINLIGNAVKFTETGGIRVVTRLIRETEGGPKLRIDVIDTGIGISGEQIDRLFQPFAQADGSTTRKFGGTGLGLMISRRLATMLGGGITIQSTPQQGSTFQVTVDTGPLDGVKMIDNPNGMFLPRAGVEDVEPIKLSGRILLAEDGPDNQRLLSFLLKRAGAEVALANNGKQAVDMVFSPPKKQNGDGRPFDVVLMDIQMPVMDGYEAMRLLRKGGYDGPIIAITAHAMPQDIRQCAEAGADSHLSKPIDQHVLLEEVARFLKITR